MLNLFYFWIQFEQVFLDKHFWVSDNQILYDGCPMDKCISNFFSYSGTWVNLLVMEAHI